MWLSVEIPDDTQQVAEAMLEWLASPEMQLSGASAVVVFTDLATPGSFGLAARLLGARIEEPPAASHPAEEENTS